MRALAAVAVMIACAGRQPTPAPAPWSIPTGWRSEVIPFPLDFAPSLKHTGVEELRFAPGMFDPAAPGYWTYAFVWRVDDATELDAAALASELTDYFRGLVDAVDEKHEITARDAIAVKATPASGGFELAVHTFDAFKTKQPIDLVGRVDRRACARGTLWRIWLAPAQSPLRANVERLAGEATCDQPVAKH